MTKTPHKSNHNYTETDKRNSSSSRQFSVSSVKIEQVDALSKYGDWARPTVIVSDGAYGLGLFPGDPSTHKDLQEWYEPHIEAWSKFALPETTLWFWCNEIGWATVHPVLEQYGWVYKGLHIWNKGIGQIAGNVNSNTIRGFPIVTEVCARYVRSVVLETEDGQKLPIKEWLRYEWRRAGLPLNKANEACDVKNAATRKYLTQCDLWYFPPPEMIEKLSKYANQHGCETNRPYFSLDGESEVTAEQWNKMRAKWNHTHAITNVWSEPPMRGDERIKKKAKTTKCAHANQKPLVLFERIIKASSDPNDVIWEPFGGLCSAAIASIRSDRRCYSAEINLDYYKIAEERLSKEKLIETPLFSLT